MPINGSHAQVTARNTTHAQISVDRHRLADKKVDVYVKYDKLADMLASVKGKRSYCQREYWSKTNKCGDSTTYADFTKELAKHNIIISSAVPQGANTGCGFCDQLYASLDTQYVIAEQNGSKIDVAKNAGSDPQLYSSDCRLIRDVHQLEVLDFRQPAHLRVLGPGAVAARAV